jgi:aminopeptidase YwaD
MELAHVSLGWIERMIDTSPRAQLAQAGLLAQPSLNRTRDWIARFGSRLAGSAGCFETGHALQRELERVCGQASLEPFVTRPAAFNGFYRVDALIYLAGVILLLLNQPLPAALLLTLMIVAVGLEFGHYVEIYDWLYPRAECENVCAVLEPRGAATQQLIFSGHHDAAQELRFLLGNQRLYALKILIPDAMRMLACVTAWSWWGGQLLAGGQPVFIPLAKIVLVLGTYSVFTKFFLFTQHVSPGAGDNLIASSLLVDLAQAFRDPQCHGVSRLEHTRLIFVSFDAEESGLRGSRAWVRAHRTELAALPTTALNFDSIYKLQDLQFLVSDLNSHVKLDGATVARCVEIARRLGYEARAAVLRFGGGATDAAELAKAGVRATTLIAMSTRLVRDGLVYHTRNDTVDAIEPEAVNACLAIAHDLALEVDRSAQDASFSPHKV